MTNLVNVQNKDGVMVVSSRDVANDFDRRHDHVIRDIENLIESMNSEYTPNLGTTKISLNYFITSTYEASNGKTNKEYLLTRDGFTLLVMGFNGNRALEFKLKYIDAFNKMEQYIMEMKKDSYMISDPIVRAKRWIEETEEKKIAEAKILSLEPKAFNWDRFLDRTGHMVFSEFNKMVGTPMTLGALIKWFLEHGFISDRSFDKEGKRQTKYMPSQEMSFKGYLKYFPSEYGTGTTKLCGQGIAYFIRRLEKDGIIVRVA